MSNRVTSTGTYIFSDCVNLKNVQLSNNLTLINTRTFNGCSSLE